MFYTHNKNVEIYVLFALKEPTNFRYVGQCVNGSAQRLKDHVKDATNGSKRWVYNWIRKYKYKIGFKIVQTQSIWDIDERRWISKLRKQGYNLTNATDGGSGSIGRRVSKATKIKIGNANRGRKHSEETKRLMSIQRLGVKKPPLSKEQKEKISRFNIGRSPSIETRERISKSLKEKYARGWRANHIK